jgi:PAS domain S-box-containing protein
MSKSLPSTTSQDVEAGFRALASQAPAGIFQSDAEGNTTFVNECWCRLAGLRAEQAYGKGWVNAIHPEDRRQISEGWGDAVRGSTASSAEFRFLHADGSVVWVHGNAVERRGPDGELLGYIGTVTDITERKAAERALQESRERLGMAMDVARIYSWEIDLEKRRVEWSPNVERVTGFRMPDQVEDCINMVHEDDRAELRRQFDEAIVSRKPYKMELRVRNPATGEVVWLRSQGIVTDSTSDGRPRFVGMTQNITVQKHQEIELRRSEQLYRAIGESIDYGIWVCDPSGRNQYLSDSFLRLLGITQEESANFDWASRLHPDDAAETLAAWRRSAATGGFWERMHRFKGADGRWHPILARGVALRDEDGRIVQWAGINLDISRLKEHEENQQRRNKVLESLNHVGNTLMQERDLQKIVQSVTDAGREVSGAKFGAFFYNVLDEEGQGYMLYTLSGAPREAFERFGMPRKTAMFAPTFDGVGVVRVGDVTKDPRYGRSAPHHGMPAGHLPVRSYLAVPVISRGGKVLGGLLYGHPEPDVFTEDAEETMLALAAQAAIAIDNVNLYEALQRELAEKKQAEKGLRESEERFRSMADNIAQFAWMADDAGRIFWYNKRWLDYAGVAPAGADDPAWASLLHRDHYLRVIRRLSLGFRGGSDWEDTFMLKSRLGGYRWFLSRAVAIRDPEGKVQRWFATCTDITDLNEAERARAHLAAIVESSEDAIVSKNLDTTIRTWNRGAELTFGYTADEAIGRPITMLIPKERLAEEDEIFRRLRQGLRIEHFETVRRRKDGSLVDISLSVSPIRDSEGRLIGASKIARDITSRKRFEKELQTARDEALAASRAKDDFLAALSHELRTPLNPALLLASESAGDATLPEGVRQRFATIRDQVVLESRLIDDLLDLTRIARGKLALEMRPLDLHAMLQDTVATVRPELLKKQIALSFRVHDDPLYVRGDAVRIRQVLWNLLNNAAKFTPPSGTITVGTGVSPDDGGVVVSISDTGLGLTPGELLEIFNAFAQGEHARGEGSRFGGLGLGLAISQRLMELHGGSITAESPGRDLGATFKLQMPRLRETAAAPVPTAGSPDKPVQEAAEAPCRLWNILLVEDHEPTREALVGLLERRGHRVFTAASLSEALQVAASADFNLLISDIGLPDGNGNDLMTELRRGKPGLQGVAFTGYGMEHDIARSRAAGFAEHLTKPVRVQSLDAALSRLGATC